MSPLHLLQAAHYLAASGSADCLEGQTCQTGLPTVTAGSGELQQLLQIFFGVIAAVAVLMIVVAGLRFITAQGNPTETGKAKGTIIYALAGLIVALIAEAVVSLVLDKLK